MSFKPLPQQKSPAIITKTTTDWLKGVVTSFDSGRTPEGGLLTTSNTYLTQDGTIGPRPSLTLYGPQPLGTVLGQIFEFKVQTGLSSVLWMVCLQNVSGTTNAYVAKGSDTTWTKCTGKNYDNSARAHFSQIQNKIIVTNGVDNLSYIDISTFTVTVFTPVTAPAAPTLDTVSTALVGTAFKVYYAITANSTVGETEGSGTLSQAVLQDRDTWNPDTMSVKIKWTTVTGVKSWNVYMGTSADGAGVPTMYLIAGGLDASTLSFTDNGSRAQDITRPLPKNNSTAGPKATRSDIINGRLWMTGDSNNPYYIWRGGDYGYELDFSPSNGGGFSPVGNGSKEVPIAVRAFRDGQGNSKITILTQRSNGAGRRFLMSPTTVTYGSSSFVVWQTQEDSGDDGTDSPDGVVTYANSLYYPSRDGFKTTGTKPQLQNVLSTDRITNTIQGDISRLNSSAMSMAVGLAYEGRLYWALPVGAAKNNEIWVLDLDRGGAWMKPWSIAADWMWLYNDENGITHHLILQNNNIFELSSYVRTSDNGVAFITDGSSGLVYFNSNGRDWGKLQNVIFTVLRPQGNLSFNATCLTDEGVLSFPVSDTYGIETTVAGWGEISSKGIVGWGKHTWGGAESVPVASGVASTDVVIEVNEEALWYTYGWSSSGPGANYQISKVTAEYVNIGIKNIQ